MIGEFVENFFKVRHEIIEFPAWALSNVFGGFLDVDKKIAYKKDAQLVFLLPGFFETGKAMRQMKSALDSPQNRVQILECNWNLDPMERIAFNAERKFRKAVLDITSHDLDDPNIHKVNLPRVVFIGHSLGGIISLHLARRNRSILTECIILGPPLKGAPLALLFFLFPSARDMLPNSWRINKFVKDLVTYHAGTQRKNVVLVTGKKDGIAPSHFIHQAWVEFIEGIKTAEIDTGHIGLIRSEKTFGTLREELANNLTTGGDGECEN